MQGSGFGVSECRIQGSGFRVLFGASALRIQDIWEFPEIVGTLFWGPYNKDPAI